MSSSDLIGDLFKSTWNFTARNFYYKSGLAAQFFLVTLAVVLIGPHVPSTSLTHDHPLVSYCVSWTLIIGVTTAVWIFKRRLPRFARNKIGVLFATKHDPELRQELSNLHDRVIDEIAQKDLRSLIEVRTAPPNQNVRSHQEALKMLTITRGRVLIWGSFEKATYQGKELRRFSSISFTCNFLPKEVAEKAEILGDSLVGRTWGWETDNSIHRSVVAANLAEVARYVVGLSLLAEQRYSEAQVILGLLHTEFRIKYASKHMPAPVARFQETVKRAYIISIVETVAQLYRNELYEDRLFGVDPRMLSLWGYMLREAIKLDENIPKARLILAIIEFLKGDIEASKQLVHQERQRFPASRAACDFSEAFLAAFCGDYHEAKRLYKGVMRQPGVTEPTFLQPILSFLEQVVVKYPDKPGLLFIVGLLNHELNDTVRARAAFEQFIVLGRGDDTLKHWLREASFRIDRITSEVSKAQEPRP